MSDARLQLATSAAAIAAGSKSKIHDEGGGLSSFSAGIERA